MDLTTVMWKQYREASNCLFENCVYPTLTSSTKIMLVYMCQINFQLWLVEYLWKKYLHSNFMPTDVNKFFCNKLVESVVCTWINTFKLNWFKSYIKKLKRTYKDSGGQSMTIFSQLSQQLYKCKSSLHGTGLI